jgi:hypothetical protein
VEVSAVRALSPIAKATNQIYISSNMQNFLSHLCVCSGEFLINFSGHNAIINAMAVNRDSVVRRWPTRLLPGLLCARLLLMAVRVSPPPLLQLVSGGDNGSMNFWDWKTGYNFQACRGRTRIPPPPVVLLSFCVAGDKQLICCNTLPAHSHPIAATIDH